MKFPPLPRQTVQCTCGKVQLVIESPSALRLVCYCKDCRGYYQTLNANANANAANKKLHLPATTSQNNAKLDPWGGLDGTQIYPSEIKVVQGNEYLTKCLIREKSPIQRIYTTCCHTPICTIGPSGAAIVNTHLLHDPLPDVQFRIIGRQALLSSNDGKNNKEQSPAPKMSWSVPFSWFWTMPGRIQKDKSSPAPLEGVKATVLENFQQG
jgi:hypothetical protein